jgi:hypothetical protein
MLQSISPKKICEGRDEPENAAQVDALFIQRYGGKITENLWQTKNTSRSSSKE